MCSASCYRGHTFVEVLSVSLYTERCDRSTCNIVWVSSAFVCVILCACVRICVRVCVSAFVRVHVRLCVCVRARTRACFECVRASVLDMRVRVRVRLRASVRVRACVCIIEQFCVCAHACVCAYVCACGFFGLSGFLSARVGFVCACSCVRGHSSLLTCVRASKFCVLDSTIR